MPTPRAVAPATRKPPRRYDTTRAVERARDLRARLRANPLATVGVGATLGWLLGGGLRPRTMRFLMANAGRAVVGAVLAAAINGVQKAD